MSGKRVRRTRRSGLNFFLTVVAAVAVVGLLGWWVTGLVTDDDALPTAQDGASSSGDDSPDEDPSSSPSEDSSDDEGNDAGNDAGNDEGNDQGNDAGDQDVRAALDTCVDQLRPVEAAVKAARPGVRSWHAHFQARTDWLEGRISADRMDAIFTRSKHAGHMAAPRFAQAVGKVEQQRPCAGLQDVGASDKQVADCKARSAAAAKALTAARRAMEEWGGHLEHMAQYADGGMSGGQAQRLWVAAWRRGPGEVAAYQRGVQALRHAPACSAT